MKRVLIANRGEIACRIMKSCQNLGLETVAVYSEADTKAKHVAMADHSVLIGRGHAKDSYLVIDKILKAAADTQTDAIHPGYGFLAENATFARKIQEQNLIWVGPEPQSIQDMGDKQRARSIAQEAQLPVVPGSERFQHQNLAGLEKAAQKVGFPLLVKASAGGGGIGMKRVDAPEKLLETVTNTQKHAEKAFGDEAIYLEKLIPQARHIEVQVFGFGNGQVVHLFERDCSIQRRFQKIIEETPAAMLPETLRQNIAKDAVNLAKHVQYRGAGTVEFIVDVETWDYYFLEMNTRIQVEHPITEMCTGRDLVEMQLKLAQGSLEEICQHQIEHQGFSLECRIYAEDPEMNFVPSPGLLKVFQLPQTGEQVRIDCGFEQGDQITFYYDPMIAKVITLGQNRNQMVDKMQEVLRTLKVEGLKTNIGFLTKVLDHPAYREQKLHTGFIDEHKSELIDNQ